MPFSCFEYSSIVHCRLLGLSIVSRKIFNFYFANTEYASFSLRKNLGSFIWRCGFFKLPSILLIFLDLLLFTFFFFLRFMIFLRLHFLCFLFSFQILFSLREVTSMIFCHFFVSVTFCRAFFLPWFSKFTFGSWLVTFFIVAFFQRLFFTKPWRMC